MKKIHQRHLVATLTYAAYALQVAACFIITGCSKDFIGIEKGQTSESKEATTHKPVEAATAGERTVVQPQTAVAKHKIAEAATAKEKATIENIIQSLQQESSHTQKKLSKLRSRRRNDQSIPNKKHDKAKHVTHNARIAACKATKAHKKEKAEKMLVTQNGYGVPTQDQADTKTQISLIQQDNVATRFVEAVQDDSDTKQHENAAWSSNVCSEFATKEGRRILEEICINKRKDISGKRYRAR